MVQYIISLPRIKIGESSSMEQRAMRDGRFTVRKSARDSVAFSSVIEYYLSTTLVLTPRK